MEKKTIREVAYKSKRTLQRKRKAFMELFLRMYKRFPTEKEYPQYDLLPVGESSRQSTEASTTETTREAAGNSGTTKQLRNADDENLSNNRKSDDEAENDMSVEEDNENEMCERNADFCNSDEIEEQYTGNFNSNFVHNDNDVESKSSEDEMFFFDDSDEDSDDDRDENNYCYNEDVDDHGDVNENENASDNPATLSVTRGQVVTMRDNVREDAVFISIIAIAVRHCLNVITILTFLKLFKKILNSCTLPVTKKAMWRRLGRREESFQTRRLYCRKCLSVIGTGKLPVRDCLCKISGPGKPLATVGFFITLNLVEQMKRILSIPDFVKFLRYPQNRKKLNRDGLEDIYDGMVYKEMQKAGRFLSNEWNFSLTLNTDGCQVAKSSRVSAWPILLTINELPPHVRKRFMILVGVWVDTNHPDLNAFLKPVVEELHLLYNTGITWKPNGVDTVCSKFVTTICCVDSVARSSILNMTRFNGKYGCPICYAKGQRCGDNRDWVYPIIEFRLRTDREMRADMERAKNSKDRVQGFIGDSILRYIPEFNLHKGVVIDSMHNMWLGVGRKLTLLLLNAKKTTDPWYIRSKNSLERLINDRLTKIRTPSKIARKPRGVENCNVWKASEWRNWTVYYCVPCLKDLIPDDYFRLFCYLSEAAHILNNESIDMQEIRKAQLLIELFVAKYEALMGLENMTYNLHILRHIPDCVANWGPLWTHSAFIYESYNRQIILSLKSPNGRQLQIMNYYVLNDFIRNVKNDPIIDPEVQQIIQDLLNTGSKKKTPHYDEYRYYDEFEGFGYPIVREPSATEVSVLEKEGEMCNGKLSTYKKATIRGLIYVSEEGDNNKTQSCDKYVFTRGQLFAKIDAIVSFENHNKSTINGAFVTYFTRTGNNCGVGHLHELIESTKGFITTKDDLTPAIIIKVHNETYGVKMTNIWETD